MSTESISHVDLNLQCDEVVETVEGPPIRILGPRLVGGRLQIVVTRDGEIEHLSVRDLMSEKVLARRDADANQVAEGFVPPILAWLSTAKRAQALEMEAHLVDVLFGRSSAPGVKDGPYDALSTTETERRSAKVAELGISQSTMTRRIQAYKGRGLAGLVPHSNRALRAVGVADVDSEVLAVVRDFVTSRIGNSKKTLKNEYALLLDDLRQRGLITLHPGTQVVGGRVLPVADEVLPYKRFRSLVRYLNLGRDPRSAKIRQQQSNRPRVEGYRHRGFDFADRIEMDSTPVDVFVQGPHGPIKAHAVFAKCVSTKYLWVRVTAGAPRGRDLALLLWDMAGGESTFTAGNRPSADVVPALPRHELALNAWRNEGRPPASMPGAVTFDHGPEEESHRLIRYCAQIGVTILWAATREPTDKAYVESAISEFARVCQLIPGHKGNTVENRPSADPDPIPTLEMLQAAVAAWQEHHVQAEHSGLPHPSRPGYFYTPLEAVHMSLTRGIPLRGLADPTRALGLLEHMALTPQDDGVTLSRRRYTCPEYEDIITASLGRDGKRRKVTFYYDPTRLGRMYWPVPGTSEVKILMTAEEAGAAVMPFADLHDHWLSATQGRKTATPNEDGKRRAALIEAMRRAMDDITPGLDEHNVIPIRAIDTREPLRRSPLTGASGWDLTEYMDLLDEDLDDAGSDQRW